MSAADPALKMHRCLLLASAFVQRAQGSLAFEVLTDSYPTAARDLADLTIELNALGYVDPLPEEREPKRKPRIVETEGNE